MLVVNIRVVRAEKLSLEPIGGLVTDAPLDLFVDFHICLGTGRMIIQVRIQVLSVVRSWITGKRTDGSADAMASSAFGDAMEFKADHSRA
jgi:hypothetical protein